MTSCLACGGHAEGATRPVDPAVPVLCNDCEDPATRTTAAEEGSA